jgi:hypothetical protein
MGRIVNRLLVARPGNFLNRESYEVINNLIDESSCYQARTVAQYKYWTQLHKVLL